MAEMLSEAAPHSANSTIVGDLFGCVSGRQDAPDRAHGRPTVQAVRAQQQAIAWLECLLQHIRSHAVFAPQVASECVLMRAACHVVEAQRAHIDEVLRDRMVARQHHEFFVAQ